MMPVILLFLFYWMVARWWPLLGQCPICRGVFYLCHTFDLLHKHGKGQGRLNCTGSGLFPVGVGLEVLEGGVPAGSAGDNS